MTEDDIIRKQEFMEAMGTRQKIYKSMTKLSSLSSCDRVQNQQSYQGKSLIRVVMNDIRTLYVLSFGFCFWNRPSS